jgi:cytochrome c peroxidase
MVLFLAGWVYDANMSTSKSLMVAGGAVLAFCALGSNLAQGAEPQKVTSGDVVLVLPLGLQADSAYIPEDNPLSKAKIKLGKMLYFDGRLSADGNVPCSGCHNPYHGFADPEPTSPGVGFARGGRNSPTVLNRLFSAEQFWDGRAEDLEAQAKGPITNPIEMGMPSHDVAVKKIAAIPGYGPLFAEAYGDPTVNIDRIAKAIATYERTVLTGDSAYDRYQAGDKAALSTQQIRGMELFAGKADCQTCHVSFNFTDENYHNLGVGWDAASKTMADKGRNDVTKADVDIGAFKTPTLRDVALTAPYMHDGSEATLADVIEFYDKGGNNNPHLSTKIKKLNLTEQERDDLESFMLALTGTVPEPAPPAKLPQ